MLRAAGADDARLVAICIDDEDHVNRIVDLIRGEFPGTKIFARSYDRGHSVAAVLRQLHAVTASGDRTQALHGVRVPATVIHGNRDPLVRPAGGRATARAIPNARLKMIDGMGHDLPRQLWPVFVEEIAATAARAGKREPVKQPV